MYKSKNNININAKSWFEFYVKISENTSGRIISK